LGVPVNELVALRDSVRGLLTRESTRTPAWSSPNSRLWRQLCDIGAAGLLIPSEYGGLDASLLELGLVHAELGRTLTPSPLLGSATLAATALLTCGDSDACTRLLPGIAAGTTVAALAWVAADGHWDPSRPACVSSPALTGEAHYVLDGTTADVLLVVATTPDGVGLFEVNPRHAHRRLSPTLDPTRPLSVVELSATPAHPLTSADFTPGLAHTRDVACVALAAEQTGAARRCLELTVDYAKTRDQFGRPIGSFQAVQHRLADLHVLVETAESTWLAAASSHDPVAAAIAAVHCSEAFSTVAAEMIQLHGGIAITWEHDAHRYFKRAHGSAHLFGHPSTHIARLTQTWQSVKGGAHPASASAPGPPSSMG
jgi:alkylation response protein AidB-like acyl-CoA dehydrogenase